jgi:hypothetical protein
MKPSVPSPELLRELLHERANVHPSEADLQRISQGALERATNFRKQSSFRQFWTASPLRPDALITPRFAFAMAALFVVSMSLAIFARLAVRESRQLASATPPILAAQPNAALRNTTPVAFPATRPQSEDAVRELPERPR